MLNACPAEDPKSKRGLRDGLQGQHGKGLGSITTLARLNYEGNVRKAVAQNGYKSFMNDLSSFQTEDLSDKACVVLIRINKQCPRHCR